MESAGEILQRVCPCGGDPSGPQHGESLLHRKWMLGQGLANDHDPIETRLRYRGAHAIARPEPIVIRETRDLP